MNVNELHLSEELLAALIDGQVTADEEAVAREHLTRCRACMATYSASVRNISDWRSGASGPEEARNATASRSRPQLRYLLAACLPLLLVAGAWWAFTVSDHSDKIRHLLADGSYHGLILPGAQNEAWSRQRTTRGAAPEEFDWDSILAGQRWRRPDPVLEIGAWVARGDFEMARIRRTEEEKAHPNDPGLLTLKGILAYRQIDPDDPQKPLLDAEKFFRQVLETIPNDPVARFNLAMVLIEMEKVDEARPLLEELVGETDHTFVSKRAEQELSILAQPDQ